jgi:hypothetical protein
MPPLACRRTLQPSTPALTHQPGAVDAVFSPGQGIETFLGDRTPTAQAGAKAPFVDADESRVHQGQLVLCPVTERQVSLLLEHVRRRGRLRPVRHLAGWFEGRCQLLAEPGSLGQQGFFRSCAACILHPGMLRRNERRRRVPGSQLSRS